MRSKVRVRVWVGVGVRLRGVRYILRDGFRVEVTARMRDQ
jgi:hypothetical protein